MSQIKLRHLPLTGCSLVFRKEEWQSLPTCRETHVKPQNIRTVIRLQWKRSSISNTIGFPNSTFFGQEGSKGEVWDEGGTHPFEKGVLFFD